MIGKFLLQDLCPFRRGEVLRGVTGIREERRIGDKGKYEGVGLDYIPRNV